MFLRWTEDFLLWMKEKDIIILALILQTKFFGKKEYKVLAL